MVDYLAWSEYRCVSCKKPHVFPTYEPDVYRCGACGHEYRLPLNLTDEKVKEAFRLIWERGI